jgi:hypothetical protein
MVTTCTLARRSSSDEHRGPGSELRSLLLLGSPGVGKTTLLRDVIWLLDSWGLNVLVVDTSNEIAGACQAAGRLLDKVVHADGSLRATCWMDCQWCCCQCIL